jgi:hypothetical protein
MDHTYHLYKSLYLLHLNHYVTFPLEQWLPFFQVLTFPF